MSHTVASPAAPVPARDRREERRVIAGTVVGALAGVVIYTVAHLLLGG